MTTLIDPKITPASSLWYGQPAGLSRLDYRSGVDGVSDWALLLPPAKGVRTWIVNLHGHGSVGDQLYTRDDIREWWLPQYLQRGFGILTPTLRGNPWMCPAAVEDLDALLAFVRQRHDAERIIFEGGSMGGTSSLIFATFHPEVIAGMVIRGAAPDLVSYLAFCRQRQAEQPILGEIADAIVASYGGTPDEQPELYRRHSAIYHADRLRGIPIFYAHGAHDEIMPVADSRRFVAAMAGNDRFTYLEVPDGDHDSPLPIGCDRETAFFKPLEWVLGA